VERGKIAKPSQTFLFLTATGTPMHLKEFNAMFKQASEKAGIEGKRASSMIFRKSFVQHALKQKMNPMSLMGTGKTLKTCFGVGWTDMKVLLEHYS